MASKQPKLSPALEISVPRLFAALGFLVTSLLPKTLLCAFLVVVLGFPATLMLLKTVLLCAVLVVVLGFLVTLLFPKAVLEFQETPLYAVLVAVLGLLLQETLLCPVLSHLE